MSCNWYTVISVAYMWLASVTSWTRDGLLIASEWYYLLLKLQIIQPITVASNFKASISSNRAYKIVGSTKEDRLEGVGRWEATQMLRPPHGCYDVSVGGHVTHMFGAMNSRQFRLLLRWWQRDFDVGSCRDGRLYFDVRFWVKASCSSM